MRLRGCRIRGRRRRLRWAALEMGYAAWGGLLVTRCAACRWVGVISARRAPCWCGRGVPGVFLGLFCIIIRLATTRICVVVLHATFNLDWPVLA